MATFKVTYFFSAGNFGWTESWYTDAEDMPAVVAPARVVANQRVTLCGNGTLIVRIKVTDVLIPGAVLIASYSSPAPPARTEAVTRDNPYNAIYVGCADQSLRYRRQVWLRGTVDDWIKFDPTTLEPVINGGMNTQIQRLATELRLNNFKMRVVNKDPLVAVRYNIGAITLQAPLNRYLITTTAAHGFNEGQSIRIGKVRGENMSQVINGKTYKVNGVWNALSITPTSFQIALIGDTDFPPLYRGNGYAVQRQIMFATVNSLSFLRYAKRDTGRPFALPVGRRQVRR